MLIDHYKHYYLGISNNNMLIKNNSKSQLTQKYKNYLLKWETRIQLSLVIYFIIKNFKGSKE